MAETYLGREDGNAVAELAVLLLHKVKVVEQLVVQLGRIVKLVHKRIVPVLCVGRGEKSGPTESTSAVSVSVVRKPREKTPGKPASAQESMA